MSTFRPKRGAPSAVNTPTVVHVSQTAAISKDEAERLLSDFITASENTAAGAPDAVFAKTGLSDDLGSGAILGQLKRVQRDLRGLPPLLAELLMEPVAEVTENKKIKFDDDGEEKHEEEEN